VLASVAGLVDAFERAALAVLVIDLSLTVAVVVVAEAEVPDQAVGHYPVEVCYWPVLAASKQDNQALHNASNEILFA
jgi:hypothetical protein